MKIWISALLLVIAALILGGLGYIGYFGGRVITVRPATAAPRPEERGIAAVFLSGDMGNHVGMGPPVTRAIAAHGLPVVAINSLTYFRTRRTPAEAQALIRRAMARALALPGIRRVVLIGQSFGSDMLQSALPGLTADERAHVVMVGLTVPGATVDFKATPGGLWSPAATDIPAAATGRLLTWVPVTCIQGKDEPDSLCPSMTMPNVTRVALPGGHALQYDSALLSRTLIAAIDTATGKPATTLPKFQTSPTARP